MSKIPRVRMLRVHVKPHLSHTKTGRPVHVKGFSYNKVDLGKPGRSHGPIEIKEPGALTNYGYNIHHSTASRRRALVKSIKRYGATSVWRMLNAQYVFRKRTQITNGRKFKADRDWVKRKYMGG